MHHHVRPLTLEQLEERLVADVHPDEGERALLGLRRGEVVSPAGGHVVDPDHPVSLGEQVIAQVGSDESRASRDEDRGHTGADRRYGVLTNLSSNNRPSFSFGFTLLSTPLAVRYRRLLPPSVPGANAMPEADTIPRPEMSIFRTRPPRSVVSRMNLCRLLTMNRCLPLTATSSAVVNPYLWVPKLLMTSSRVPNLLSLPRLILYTRRFVESDTIS